MNISTKAQKRAPLKIIAVILAILVALTAIGYGIGSTFAAPGDVPVTLSPPTGISAANTLEVGATKTQTVLNLNDAVIGDISLATISFTQGTSADNLRVTGVSAGVVTAAYGNKQGAVLYTRYQITDSQNVSAYTLHNNGAAHFEKTDSSAAAAPVTFDVTDPGVTWSSTNSTVVTVDETTGVISPVGYGAAIIVGTFTDKWGREQDVHILAIVGEIGAGGNGGGGTTFPPTTPPNPITEIPTGIENGKTLTPDKSGDTVDWIEIARNGDYSLIVRTDFINITENHFGEAQWQGDHFGSNNSYQGSYPQIRINDWFNGRSSVENLDAEARLRSFTVSNNASSVLGTGSSDEGGLTNGYSKPTNYQTGAGNDVAFALSFTEAANFISKEYNVTLGGGVAPSSQLAISNFNRLKQYSPTVSLWLRSPGTNDATATELRHGDGRAFQINTGTATALVYPALWVHNSIFD